MNVKLFGIRFSVNSEFGVPQFQAKFNGMETYICLRKNGTVGWNSEHIAKWLGQYHESECEYGYTPDYYEYKGILGCHHLV